MAREWFRAPAVGALAMAVVSTLLGSLALKVFGARGPGSVQAQFAEQPFIHMWMAWDAGWYEEIAERGYSYSTTRQSAVAYFPLYPLLMRAMVVLGFNAFIAGIALTVTFGALAVRSFTRWAECFMQPEPASRARWVLLLWPLAFYLYGAIYADALFLCLISTAFWQLEQGHLGRATVLGALATATRPLAPAVVLGLLIRQLELKRRRREPLTLTDFAPVLSCAGLLAYMLFLQLRFDDPLAFLHAQAGWGQTPGLHTVFKLGLFERAKRASDFVLPGIHLGLALITLASTRAVGRRFGWGYAAYVLLAVGLPLISSRDCIGLGRYALAAFPAFAAISLELENRPRLRGAWRFVSVGLLVGLLVMYAEGKYVS